MRRLLARVLAAAALAVAVFAGVSLPASAGPLTDTDPTRVSSVCTAKPTFDYQYLPVERWSGATQELHVRSNGGLLDFAPAQRQLQSLSFVTGDFLYAATTRFVTWSTQLCPLQAVGGAVDTAAAALGSALVDSALLAAVLALTVVVLVARGLRGDPNWLKQLATKILVIALFAIMVAGSAGSRGGGIDGDFDTPYTPGRGSPGWFAATTDQVVTELAAAPAAALSAQSVIDSVGSGDELDCAPYLGALQEGYTTHASGGGLLKTTATPALTVSNLWQISGYNAWAVGQFGNKNLNGQARVACRMLDKNAAIPVGLGTFQLDGADAASDRSAATVTDVMARVPATNVNLRQAAAWVKPNAPAWRPLAGAEADKAWIAWATCVPRDGKLANISQRDGWQAPAGNSWLIADESARKGADTTSGSSKLNAACYDFFNVEDTSVDGIFDWGEGDRELRKHANEMPASIYDFISALHGTNQGAGAIASLSYLASALGVAVVFGGLGLAILAVKVIALVMLFSVFFMMAVVLLPNADNSKLVKYAKEYVGLSLFAAFSVFVMAMVTLFVKIIWLLLGNFTGGPNSVMTMLVGGLAPVLAAYALHRAFIGVGMPSPMTVKGATAWGSALAGGAATGALVSGIGRLSDGARGLAHRGSDRARDLAVTGAKAKLGGAKRNADLTSSDQKSAVHAPEGAILAAAQEQSAAASLTAEQVLADPKASAAAKRAAQRELAEERKAARAQAGEEKTAARAEQQRAQETERARRAALTPRQRASGYADRALQRGAHGVRDRGLDAQRWAAAVGANPVQSLSRVAHAVPGGAVGVAGLLGVATVAGLPGIAAGAGVVGGGLAAKVVQRKIRSHSEAQQEALRAYRRRVEAERRSAENESGGSTAPAPATHVDGAGLLPVREGQAETRRSGASPAPPSLDWADSIRDGTLFGSQKKGF